MFIGIFGSRRFCAGQAAAVVQHLLLNPAHTFVIPAEAYGSTLSVAAIARRLIPTDRAQVVQATLAGTAGLVQRASIACRTLAINHGTAYILPAVACPAALRPSPSASRCWAGHGNGSWAEAAHCVGLGVRVVVFTAPPASWSVFAEMRPVAIAGFPAWLLSPRNLTSPTLFS